MLRELVRLSCRQLEFLGALGDFLFERVLVAFPLRSRFGKFLSHVIKGVGQ